MKALTHRLFAFTLFVMSAVMYGQTIIHQESFENAPNGAATDYSADTEFGTNDPNDYWQRIDITGNGKSQIDTGVTGGDGTKMYAGEDMDSASPTPKVITIVNTDVTGYQNIQVQIAAGSGEQNKYDSGDYIEVYVKKDGGNETLIGAFYGYDHQNGDGLNGRMYQDVNLNGSTSDDGSSAQLSKAMQDFTFDVTGSFTQLQVIIKMSSNSGSEILMVDNVRILGTAGNGPVITNITQTPANVTSSDTVSVSADVTDSDGIAGVELHWGTANGNLSNTINMSLSSGDTYSTDTDIPAQADGTSVYYEIYALDNNADDTTSDEQAYTVNDTPVCASELIFSEYIEGSGNNKYLEIYNGTGAAVNLNDYDVKIYSNGNSSAGTTIPLNNVNLAHGAVYVLAHSSANTWSGTPDQTTGSLNFNGDDAIELLNTSTNQSVDVIGQIGNDPGSAWGSGSTSTKDHTLVRKAGVTSGDTNGSDAFDPAVEWNGYAQNETSYLGSHTMTCSTCVEPASDAAFHANSPQNITTTSLTLNWTSGDGENRIVVLREANPVTFVPADGNTYTGNTDYSAATDVSGNGEYVVYNGNGSTVDVTGLTPGTLYHAVIYEYNCAPGSEDYFTSGTPATDSFYTIPGKPDSFTADCVGKTSIDLSWTAPANGNYDGFLVVAREGAIPHSVNSLDPNTNLGENTDYSAAATYGSSSPYSHILYKGTGTSATITGLTNGTAYTFQVFAYATNGTLYRYSDNKQLSKTIELNEVTSALSTGANQEVSLSWMNPGSTCFDEILVVANETAGIDFTPSGDGSAYTANATYSGINSIVYKDTGNQVTVTGLTNGTTYYFEIFVRKGTDWSDGVEVSGVPNNITVMATGDLAILAVNTDIDNQPGSTGNGSGDQIAFVCFQDITPGTKLYLTDNGYEREVAGKWGNTEGVIAITRLNSSLPKGTIIVIETNANTNGNITADDHFDVYTCGAIDSDWQKEYIAGQGGFNLNNDDDVWIMQGGIWNNGIAGHHDATFDGNVLYGWTESGWDNGVGNGSNGTKWSNLFPSSKCFTTIAPNGDGKVKFNDPNDPDFSATTNDQLDWIALINTTANWDSYSTTSDYNNNGYDYKGSTTCPAMTITASNHLAGYWKGDNSNWFDCSNWDDLTVPDENTDVTIPSSASNPALISASATYAELYNQIAQTNDLTIETNNWVEVNTSADVLEVHGNLTIDNNAMLVMNDNDNSTTDGHLLIWGDWTNNYGDDGFDQGNSKVTFKGSTPQSVNAGSVTEKFYDLEIDNPTGVTFNSGNIHAEGTLSIQNSPAISISDGHYLLAGNSLDNTAGTLIDIASQGSLIQTATGTDANTGNLNGSIRIHKTTGTYTSYDYIYWSSPVDQESIGSALGASPYAYWLDTSAFNDNYSGSYPQTSGSPDGFDDEGDDWVPANATEVMTPAKGYIAMGEGSPFPISNPLDTSSHTQSVVFDDGKINNGDIDISVTADNDSSDGFENQNLIGNPYPSAIDIELLAQANSSIFTGDFYFWTHDSAISSSNAGPDTYNFTNDDYSQISIDMGTGLITGITAGSNGTQANRYIASCQGFLADVTGNGTVHFNNSMRVYDNTHFRNNAEVNTDYFKLNLTDESGSIFRQIWIGFYEGASDSYVPGQDGVRLINGNNTDFYSFIPEDDRRLAIQNLSAFEPGKKVYLGLEIVQEGDYTITPVDASGIFAEGQNIWLVDRLLSVTHPLHLTPYHFHSVTGENIEDRFYIVFTQQITGTAENETAQVVIYPNPAKDTVEITADFDLSNIRIVDMKGDVINTLHRENASTTWTINAGALPQGVYILDISGAHKNVKRKLIVGE